MSLTTDEVRHLAALARVNLTDAEVEQFTGQLSEILEYVGQLREVAVDVDAEAVANISGLENVMREDEIRVRPREERDAILAQFPLRDGELLKTPGTLQAK
ncbi:MAG: Asp-tRNA(Asn)/Glu-tRNA(Gln) amidotransferase subunit GatC [bacterium]|nr:Asp-tRNA(Asn)/Glu-tRNA(Gln) amidotransferase subunit GatC [bacterium]